MEKYHCMIDGGAGGEMDIWALDANDALEQAIAWAKGGDWTYPAAFRVSVYNEDDPSDTATELVEVDEDPNEEDEDPNEEDEND